MDNNNILTVKIARELLKTYPTILPEILSGFAKELNEYKSASKNIPESFKNHFEGFENALKKIGEAFTEYAKYSIPSLELFADHGWYVCGSSEMGDSLELQKEIKKGHFKKVDIFMVSFYENEFESIISNIKTKYPEKSNIINQAKRAHKLKMYHASTLLFLSIADGIFDGLLYKKSNRKQNLKKRISKTKHLKEHGDIILKISAIDSDERDLHQFRNPLNRHRVVHGKDANFGNKINSFKAFSLLAFICDFFEFNSNLKHSHK